MHNITKIKLFRILLWITYLPAWILIKPWICLKKKKSHRLFFFFDRYVLGGAQRVHLDILESINDIPKTVWFTRKSYNDVLKKQFYSLPNILCRDIHFWCDNLLFRLFTVHFYAFYINRHKNAHVFSSNSTFFYDMLPFLRKEIQSTELLHNFTYGKDGFEFFGLVNHQYLNNRIVVDAFTLENIRRQYAEYNIQETYLNRIQLIEPGVDIPSVQLQKNYSLPLKILYAGRGGSQKRVWLISKIAEYFIEKGLPAEFHFAGPVLDELSSSTKDVAVIHGEVGSKEKMNEIYAQCHVIILTSAYEGFPMVIKEGMAHGCVPIVTALGGNKTHLTNGINALLIDAIENENEVIQQGIEQIKKLLEDPVLMQNLSKAAFNYARKNFGKESFFNAYRKLLT